MVSPVSSSLLVPLRLWVACCCQGHWVMCASIPSGASGLRNHHGDDTRILSAAPAVGRAVVAFTVLWGRVMGTAMVLGASGYQSHRCCLGFSDLGYSPWYLEGKVQSLILVGLSQLSTTVITVAYGFQCHCSSWSLQSWVSVLSWFYQLHKFQSTYLQMHRCVTLSSIPMCHVENPRMGYICPAGCSLKGRDKGNDSCWLQLQ